MPIWLDGACPQSVQGTLLTEVELSEALMQYFFVFYPYLCNYDSGSNNQNHSHLKYVCILLRIVLLIWRLCLGWIGPQSRTHKTCMGPYALHVKSIAGGSLKKMLESTMLLPLPLRQIVHSVLPDKKLSINPCAANVSAIIVMLYLKLSRTVSAL